MRSLRACCFLAQLRSLGRICSYLCEITHLNPMFGHPWINCIRCVYRGSQARGRGHSLPTRACSVTTITGCFLGAVVVYFCWVVNLSAFITLDHYNIMQDPPLRLSALFKYIPAADNVTNVSTQFSRGNISTNQSWAPVLDATYTIQRCTLDSPMPSVVIV